MRFDMKEVKKTTKDMEVAQYIIATGYVSRVNLLTESDKDMEL